MEEDLREKGLQEMFEVFDGCEEDLNFLGRISDLREHAKVVKANPVRGLGSFSELRNYKVYLKEEVNEIGILSMLSNVGFGEPLDVDSSYSAGTEVLFKEAGKKYKIFFFKPGMGGSR